MASRFVSDFSPDEVIPELDGQIPDIPNPPFLLSNSFDDIVSFLGLSMETYRKGFQTRREVFQWAVSCKYFDHRRFQTRGEGITKVKQERRMYTEFIEWVEESRSRLATESRPELNIPLPRAERCARAKEDAMLFFHKWEDFEAIIKARTGRQRFKAGFNGTLVQEWAELSGANWEDVKMIMDEVKKKLGGDAGILDVLDTYGQDQLKELVRLIKDDLNIVTRRPAKDSESKVT